MAELTELDGTRHQHTKVVEHCAMEFAATQHVINLRVVEVSKAVSSFPVFFTRNTATGQWGLSALGAFEPGHNLFVQNNHWQALYTPTGIQTYPLFLMQSPREDNQYTIGIDEQSQAFSQEHGQTLFDGQNKASLYLGQIKTLLAADIKNDIHTRQFSEKLQSLKLIKRIDVLVHYADKQVKTLKGLHTIDESVLQALTAEQLSTLHSLGYLAPIHAMLISIHQLNGLIQKHNAITGNTNVTQVKLHNSRDH